MDIADVAVRKPWVKRAGHAGVLSRIHDGPPHRVFAFHLGRERPPESPGHRGKRAVRLDDRGRNRRADETDLLQQAELSDRFGIEKTGSASPLFPDFIGSAHSSNYPISTPAQGRTAIRSRMNHIATADGRNVELLMPKHAVDGA